MDEALGHNPFVHGGKLPILFSHCLSDDSLSIVITTKFIFHSLTLPSPLVISFSLNILGCVVEENIFLCLSLCHKANENITRERVENWS